MALGPAEAAATAAKQQAEALLTEDIPRTRRHLSKAQTTNQHPCAVSILGGFTTTASRQEQPGNE
jgi:hypothetical protein